MKLKLSRMLLVFGAVALLSTFSIGCKSKLNDADVKSAIETALKADPLSAGTIVDVKDGIATISGECKDEVSRAACEKAVAAIKGVKSVVNNCTVALPANIAPVISADDPLTAAVNDALKAYPGVSATVKDGVVSLAGKIAKFDRQKLMIALQSLKPKRVDVKSLLNN